MESGFEVYKRGFADGQEVFFDKIVNGFEEDPHPASCGCKPCLAVNVVWGEAMRTVQEMIGPEEWHRLGNSLGAAVGQPPRPPHSD